MEKADKIQMRKRNMKLFPTYKKTELGLHIFLYYKFLVFNTSKKY